MHTLKYHHTMFLLETLSLKTQFILITKYSIHIIVIKDITSKLIILNTFTQRKTVNNEIEQLSAQRRVPTLSVESYHLASRI